MRKNKIALTLAAVAMVGTLAVGGTLAWFTDTETATNVVTTGNVDIELTEESKDGEVTNDGYKYDNLTPDSTKEKIVTIENTGKNDAYVQLKVEVKTNNDYIQSTFKDADLENNLQILDKDGEEVVGAFNWQEDENGNFVVTIPYDEVLKVNNTWNPIQSFYIPSVWNNNATDAEIEINLTAEAIQADNMDSAEEAFTELNELDTVLPYEG